jgi:hypothetical protein
MESNYHCLVPTADPHKGRLCTESSHEKATSVILVIVTLGVLRTSHDKMASQADTGGRQTFGSRYQVGFGWKLI